MKQSQPKDTQTSQYYYWPDPCMWGWNCKTSLLYVALIFGRDAIALPASSCSDCIDIQKRRIKQVLIICVLWADYRQFCYGWLELKTFAKRSVKLKVGSVCKFFQDTAWHFNDYTCWSTDWNFFSRIMAWTSRWQMQLDKAWDPPILASPGCQQLVFDGALLIITVSTPITWAAHQLLAHPLPIVRFLPLSALPQPARLYTCNTPWPATNGQTSQTQQLQLCNPILRITNSTDLNIRQLAFDTLRRCLSQANRTSSTSSKMQSLSYSTAVDQSYRAQTADGTSCCSCNASEILESLEEMLPNQTSAVSE